MNFDDEERVWRGAVKGGQGRTGADVRDGAAMLLILLLLGIATATVACLL